MFLDHKKVVVKGKNKITRDLSSSVTEKFNGYQTIKYKLACKEQMDHEPLCIVYDPSYLQDENTPILCFFTDQIHLAYRSQVGRIVNGKGKIFHSTSLPCENLLTKTVEKINKHNKIYAAKEGRTYTFDNGDVISF